MKLVLRSSVLLLMATLAFLRARGAAEPELPALPPLHVDFAHPGVTILHPVAGGYPAIARRLAEALGKETGLAPAVAPETQLAAVAAPKTLVVLGNLMDSTVVRRLYLEAYDFTDYAFPGPGGWAVRTIRDPLGVGATVVLVAGSDEAGVAEAADQLVARVHEDGPEFGYVNDVRLGQWTTAEQMITTRYLADNDAAWQRVGQSGSWDYMDNIARCGTGYLRTGDRQYLKLFARELERFMATDVYNPNPEAMQMLHGRLYVLLVVWDLVRDHPQFTDAQRRKVDQMFLDVARSTEGTKQIAAEALSTAVRYNHHTRAGLDAFFVGRYFDRRYALPEAKAWLETAGRLFAPQLASAKPAEDSWGHQWAASLFNTLVYALATGRADYVRSPAFRHAADRALIAYGRAPPRHYLSACAVATGDTGYLSLERDLATLARDAAQLRLVPPGAQELVTFTDEVLRTFTARAPITRRADLLGLGVAPVDPLWRESIETGVYNPGKIFAVTVPGPETFDKAALRDGWSEKDFYLLLDGISGGQHAYQDANCLVWMREGGVDWFEPQTGYLHSMGVRWQNGVNVALDGRGPDHLHRYARLLYQGTKGEFSAIGTSLDGIGAVTWERHILRRRNAWTLVVDRAVSAERGELLFERSWFPHGATRAEHDGFTSRQAAGPTEIFLHLASTVAAVGGDGGGVAPLERVRTRVEAGAQVAVAGLMWTDQRADRAGCRVTATGSGWRIDDAGGQTWDVALTLAGTQGRGLVVRNGAGALAIGAERDTAANPLLAARAEALPLTPPMTAGKLAWRQVQAGTARITAVASGPLGYAVGMADGTVIAYTIELRERWRATRPSGILSLELDGEEVVVGEERGGVSLFDRAGRRRWTVEIPWVTLPWAYWGEERSRIRELAVADLDGDGANEILAANADRRVYAFDRTGRELWKRPIEWGVFTAMWPGAIEGKFALAGGTSRPSIHGWTVLLGADGAVSGHRQRPDLTSWSLPANTRDLQWVDLEGDGKQEIVCALDTNCRQLVAYAPDGTVKWDLDVAGAALALAFDAAHRQIVVASSAGYIAGVNGATGRRQWLAWIGEPASLVSVLPDGRIMATTERGRVWALSAAGEILGVAEAGEAITAVLRPGNHRALSRRLIIGTESGRALVMP